MIPDVPNSEFEIVSYDTRTFKLNLDNNTIAGMIDDVEALKQTIETILMTERYKWADGPTKMEAVLFTIDTETGLCKKAERVDVYD